MNLFVFLGPTFFMNITAHIDNDACKYMTCPVESYNTNKYKYTGSIPKSPPRVSLNFLIQYLLILFR